MSEGAIVGMLIDGERDGDLEGTIVGATTGGFDGMLVGEFDGDHVKGVGWREGATVGIQDGETEGH